MVDGRTADFVAVGQLAVRMVFRDVDDQINLVVLHKFRNVGVVGVFVGPANALGSNTVVDKEFLRASGGVNLKALLLKHFARVEQVNLAANVTRRYQNSLLRLVEAHRVESGQQCVVEVGAKAANLTRRRHIDAQNRVGAVQTGKRELRSLHADVVDVEIRRVGLLNRLAEHNLCCGLNKVAFHNLRHKRERTRCAQVALNHLNLVIFSKILNVERSADVQLFGYLLAYLFDAACCCQIDVLRGEHQRCVARVDARKLNVLRDCVLVNLAVLGHGVELYLLGILHKLRNHNRILLRHFGGGVQEGAHLVLVVADVHCRAREHVRRTNQHGEANLVDKLVNLLETCQSLPARLVDAQLVEHCRELVAVFGAVNRNRRSTKDWHILTI